jgi:Fuc2NAc and GlcNAc transferase
LVQVVGIVLFLALLVAIVALGTGRLLSYAVSRDMIDRPGRRSSHTRPTPRGGGLAAALAWTAGLVLIGLIWGLAWEKVVGLVGGSLLVMTAGWLEDRRGLPPLIRLAFHLAAAIWFLGWLGGWPVVVVGPWRWEWGLWGWVAGALWIVWFVNLFNFMDGIDGLAGMEVVFAAGAAGLMLGAGGHLPLALAALSLAAAALGFLFWNFPPAKIFMGDVGSYTFGFGLAAMCLAGDVAGGLPFWVSVILLFVFVADATYTLIRRMARGESFFKAHRSHFYQRAVQTGLTHAQVDFMVTGLNVVLIVLALGGLWSPRLFWVWIGAAVVLVCLGAMFVRHRESRFDRLP